MACLATLRHASFLPHIMESPRYYLDMACRQQADLEIVFLHDRAEISRIHAQFAALGAGHLAIRATAEEAGRHPILWGCACRCHFSLRDVEALSLSFTSRVERFYNGPGQSLVLILGVPGAVDLSQRRFSMRVELGEEDAAAFAVWRGSLAGSGAGGLPALSWEELSGRPWRLAELSASGCRMTAPADAPDTVRLEDNILLRGDFGGRQPNLVFILGNVVRLGESREDGGKVLGCRFRAWRKAGSARQDWFRSAGEEGLGFVGEWVSRHLFRKAR